MNQVEYGNNTSKKIQMLKQIHDEEKLLMYIFHKLCNITNSMNKSGQTGYSNHQVTQHPS